MAILIAIALAVLASARAAAASDRGVVSLPLAFPVRNANSSAVLCASDGAAYVVRGHITGPRAALDARQPSVAVYGTGLEVGEWSWRLSEVPGYDWPLAMARMGHVSLTVDPLGYGASGLPRGAESCWGSQAYVLHQIVGRLRAGDYTVSGHSPISFARVASVGHDVGGAIAQLGSTYASR